MANHWQSSIVFNKEKWTQNLFLYVAKLQRKMERMATTERYKSKLRELFSPQKTNDSVNAFKKY